MTTKGSKKKDAEILASSIETLLINPDALSANGKWRTVNISKVQGQAKIMQAVESGYTTMGYSVRFVKNGGDDFRVSSRTADGLLREAKGKLAYAEAVGNKFVADYWKQGVQNIEEGMTKLQSVSDALELVRTPTVEGKATTSNKPSI